MEKYTGWIIAGIVGIVIAISCCLSNIQEKDTIDQVIIMEGIHHAVIKVKDYGDIKLELDADTAPITVTNFVYLANIKFYDGLTFHKVIDGFIIQGGDPTGLGTGGSGQNITGEFEKNGVKNDISHVRGTISMAHKTSYDSGSSQFFIVHKDATYLDGEYAAFGHVIEGMDIVDKIVKDYSIPGETGSLDMDHRPIIETIEVID